jgi:hypothetical protein
LKQLLEILIVAFITFLLIAYLVRAVRWFYVLFSELIHWGSTRAEPCHELKVGKREIQQSKADDKHGDRTRGTARI